MSSRPTDDDDDEDTRGHRGNAKSNHIKVANLKNELRALMAQPLVARGISSKYITGGSRKIVDDLIQGTRMFDFSPLSVGCASKG